MSVKVVVTPSATTVERVEQGVIFVPGDRKRDLLVAMLREEGTLERLKALRRELLDPKITEHHGRIVKTTGDGLLVEFASVILLPIPGGGGQLTGRAQHQGPAGLRRRAPR